MKNINAQLGFNWTCTLVKNTHISATGLTVPAPHQPPLIIILLKEARFFLSKIRRCFDLKGQKELEGYLLMETLKQVGASHPCSRAVSAILREAQHPSCLSQKYLSTKQVHLLHSNQYPVSEFKSEINKPLKGKSY